ncbi:MAG TPA: class I SAM-dependent methyltransferase [Candidatus Eisenbacteria bacterium]|nr:class I SAM-dependent methyltransferase [Candidatus Eisenbacteria bacterium]
MKPAATLVEEFDAIAEALAAVPAIRERLSSAERDLLRWIPAGAGRGLDVGCGDGLLTRAAARRGIAMLGIDLSPRMIALARARSGPDVAYRVADVMNDAIEPGAAYDIVLSVNTVHHLPLAAIVPRLAALVAPGGRLLVQDVVTRARVSDLPLNLAAGISRMIERTRGRWRFTSELKRLYHQHGHGERYLDPGEVRGAYQPFLPGLQVMHHLQWRYSIVWTRPRAEKT